MIGDNRESLSRVSNLEHILNLRPHRNLTCPVLPVSPDGTYFKGPIRCPLRSVSEGVSECDVTP